MRYQRKASEQRRGAAVEVCLEELVDPGVAGLAEDGGGGALDQHAAVVEEDDLRGHEIGFAASVASKIVFLDHGKVLVEGPSMKVFGKPRHPRIDQFLETYLDRGAATLL